MELSLITRMVSTWFLLNLLVPPITCQEESGDIPADKISVITHDENVAKVTGLYHDGFESGLPTNGPDGEQKLPRGHLEKLGNQGELLIDELPVVDYMIGGQDFYEHFIRKRQPVIFKGVTSEWVATKQWKNETYLLETYPDVLFDVEMGKVYEYSQHPRQTMTMREFLARYRVETKMYLDSPFPQSPMMLDMEVPLMMQCEKLYTRFKSAHMLFSCGNSSCPLHYDGYENFLTVMAGVKVAYLAHYKYANDVYIDDYHDFPGLSPVNPESIDLVKYPKFSNVPFHKVTLQPGDMLYIPQGWFHQVRSYESPNIAVSMWFHYFDLDDGTANSTAVLADLERSVTAAPSTIECGHQAMPMVDFNDLVLNDVGETVVGRNAGNEFVNRTVLYDLVSTGDAMLYVGSDDHWIYAVEINSGKVKWKVETREDTGSMCAFSMDANLVYCGADDGFMRAIRVEDGVVVWAFNATDRVISSAVLDKAGIIFFGSFDHFMYALFPNGTLKWRTDLNNSVMSTPVIDEINGIVYIAAGSSVLEMNSNVFALRLESGEVVWKKYSIHGFKSSPKLNPPRGEMYLCDNGGNVYVFNALTGDLKQRYDVDDPDGILSTPAVHESGMLFVASHAGKLLAYQIETEEVIWQLEIGKGGRGTNSSPYIGKNNMLYIGSGNGTVFAIQPSTGHIEWRTDIGSGVFFSSARLASNGLLYIGSVDGPLYALDAITGSVKWTVKTDGPLVGTPLITREFR